MCAVAPGCLKIFDAWLAGSEDVEPTDTEGACFHSCFLHLRQTEDAGREEVSGSGRWVVTLSTELVTGARMLSGTW